MELKHSRSSYSRMETKRRICVLAAIFMAMLLFGAVSHAQADAEGQLNKTASLVQSGFLQVWDILKQIFTGHRNAPQAGPIASSSPESAATSSKNFTVINNNITSTTYNLYPAPKANIDVTKLKNDILSEVLLEQNLFNSQNKNYVDAQLTAVRSEYQPTVSYAGTLPSALTLSFENFQNADGINFLGNTPIKLQQGSLIMNGVTRIDSSGTATLGATTLDSLSVAGSATFVGLTNGSILFATSSGVVSQDNSNFFWDSVNHRLGIGTTTPTASLSFLQSANSVPIISARRFTDTAPSGDFIDYTTNGGTILFRVDNSGNLLAGGIVNSGSQTITSTSTPQFRVQYNSSNEWTSSVNASGTTTFAANGSAPAFVFTPQSNNVNTFNFTNASSSSILSVDTSDQRVGIGTTTPQSILDTAGTAQLRGFSTSTAGLYVNGSGNVGIGTTTPVGTLGIIGSTTISNALAVGTTNLVVTGGIGSGNVGIGTSNPTYKLQVNGGALSSLIKVGDGNDVSISGAYGLFSAATQNAGFTINKDTVSQYGSLDFLTGGSVSTGWSIQMQPNDTGLAFVDRANNTLTRLYLKAGGNVGIGTTTPNGLLNVSTATSSILNVLANGNVSIGTSTAANYKLQVWGATGGFIASDVSTNNSTLIIQHGVGGSDPTIQFKNSNGTNQGVIDAAGSVMVFGTQANSPMRFDTNSLTRLWIKETGEIGVGTTSPATLLDVYGAAPNLSLSDSGGRQFRLRNGSAAAGTFDIYDNASATSRLAIDKNGNVGIGTTTPQNTLTISGTTNPTLGLVSSAGGGGKYQLRVGSVGNGFDIFDQVASATALLVNQGSGGKSGNIYIGTSTNIAGNSSRLFVFGGSNGANVDVMGDSSIVGGDQAFVELEGSDYATNFDSAALRFYGPNGLGTTMGFANKQLGVLEFYSTSTIFTDNNAPLVFGTNLAERMRITGGGNVGIGTTTPQSLLNLSAANPILRLSDTAASGRQFEIRNGSSTAGTLDIYDVASATSRLAIDKNGNVGIGTTTPPAVLSVNGNTIIGFSQDAFKLGVGTTTPSYPAQVHSANVLSNTFVQTRGTGPANIAGFGVMGLKTLNAVGLSYADNTGTLTSSTVQLAAASNGGLLVGSYANGSIDPPANGLILAGNVGIGTTTPNSLLTVASTSGGILAKFTGSVNPRIQVASGTVTADMYVVSPGTAIFGSVSNNPVAFTVNDSIRMYIDTTGNVGIGTSTPQSLLNLSAANPILRLSDTAASGRQFEIRNGSSTAGTLDIFDVTSSSSRLAIDKNGNVGIGTTTPSTKLVVSGGAVSIFGDNVGFTGGGFNTYGGWTNSYYSASTSLGALNTTYLAEGNTATHSFFDSDKTGSATVVPLDFQIQASTKLTIATSGNVGIGTTTPAYRLVVGDRTTQADVSIPKGAICVDDATGAGCPTSPTAGVVYASSTAITAIDLAENYSTTDNTLEPGDVVAPDKYNKEFVIRASDSESVFGIISTAPGVLLGRKIENSRPVALAGRVPLKVNLENGPIAIGDRLMLSSTPGVAMKQTESGESIGVALEAFDGNMASTTKISTFVHPGFALVVPPENAVSTGIASTILSKFTQAVKGAIAQIADLVVKSLTADYVVTNKLCLGSTCIVESDLQNILSKTGTGVPTPAVLTSSQISQPAAASETSTPNFASGTVSQVVSTSTSFTSTSTITGDTVTIVNTTTTSETVNVIQATSTP